jgi:protein transport protein SEC23
VLNPYCRVDFINKIFLCPFCNTRNHFPHRYADMSTENRPVDTHVYTITVTL